MIATVTFNPSLDYIVSVDSFRTGKLNRASAEAIYPGGKGINVSIVLQRLGIETKAYGFLGGATGRALEEMLSNYGIVSDFIFVADGMTRINVKLKSRVETEINGRGPIVGEGELRALFDRLKELREGDSLVLSGSVPAGMRTSLYADVIRMLDNRHIKVIVDASGALLSETFPHHPFLVKPNKEELGGIFSVTMENTDQIAHYARTLQKWGVRNVLVSLGSDGAILIDERGVCHERKAPSGVVVNSVGAGDSMVAGFLASLSRGGSPAEALEMGIAAGSASAFAGKLADRDEIMEVLKKVHETYSGNGENR